MKRIIIPTDLTLQSLNLVKYALHLLKGEICQIYLVHPIPLPDSITELLMLSRDENSNEKINPTFTKALERLRKAYAIEIHDIQVELLYCDSPTHLTNYVLKHKIDLVLSPVPMGVIVTDDTLQLFHMLVQDVPCPILSVPELFEINRFNRIAFVVDPEAHQNTLPDKQLIDLLCKNDYHITFLLVFAPGTGMPAIQHVFNQVYASDVSKNLNCSLHLLQESDVTTGVISYIEKFEVDLVVTYKKKSMFDYLKFGKSRRLRSKAIHSKVPYLSIR